LRTSDEDPDEYIRIQVYQEGLRNDRNTHAKTRDLSSWSCYENAAMASFSRPYRRATRWFSTRGLVSSSRSPFCLYIPL